MFDLYTDPHDTLHSHPEISFLLHLTEIRHHDYR
jgi:hypothetical protein